MTAIYWVATVSRAGVSVITKYRIGCLYEGAYPVQALTVIVPTCGLLGARIAREWVVFTGPLIAFVGGTRFSVVTVFIAVADLLQKSEIV